MHRWTRKIRSNGAVLEWSRQFIIQFITHLIVIACKHRHFQLRLFANNASILLTLFTNCSQTSAYAHIICQMIIQVRRWLPHRAMVLVGDGAYAAVKLALCCAGFPMPVCLVSRLRLDASLYDFPLPEQPGKRGRSPKKGKGKLPWPTVSRIRKLSWFPLRLTGMTESNAIWKCFPESHYGINPA